MQKEREIIILSTFVPNYQFLDQLVTLNFPRFRGCFYGDDLKVAVYVDIKYSRDVSSSFQGYSHCSVLFCSRHHINRHIKYIYEHPHCDPGVVRCCLLSDNSLSILSLSSNSLLKNLTMSLISVITRSLLSSSHAGHTVQ